LTPAITRRISTGIASYLRDGGLWLRRWTERKACALVRKRHGFLGTAGRRTVQISWLFVSRKGDHSFLGIYDANTKTVRSSRPVWPAESDVEWSPAETMPSCAASRSTQHSRGLFIEPIVCASVAIRVRRNSRLMQTNLAQRQGLQDAFPYMADDTGGCASGGPLIIPRFRQRAGLLASISPVCLRMRRCAKLRLGNWRSRTWGVRIGRANICLIRTAFVFYDVDRAPLWSVSAPAMLRTDLASRGIA